jgi:maltase-glucoamylase
MNVFEDFTYDHKNFEKFPELVAETKKDLNLRWTVIIDPAIQANDTTYDTFTKGYQQNVFVRWPKSIPIAERSNPNNTHNDKDVMYGRVWPRGPAGFPDFFKNATKTWWTDNMRYLYNNLSVKFDAIWIV